MKNLSPPREPYSGRILVADDGRTTHRDYYRIIVNAGVAFEHKVCSLAEVATQKGGRIIATDELEKRRRAGHDPRRFRSRCRKPCCVRRSA
jgi:hypothetical protein